MPTPQELEAEFWKALESDRTMMLGLDGVEDGHTRPMTAQTEGPTGPIWFFSARDNALVQALASKNVQLNNVVEVQTAANGGKIVYYR